MCEGRPDDGDRTRDVAVTYGEPVEAKLDVPCLICGTGSVLNASLPLYLPHFGNALQTTFRCTSCGFRHSDIIMLENRGPTRYDLFVNDVEALSSKVVRSNSGTIRLPEIGAIIEPGGSSESFISNVEGVLNRIARAISLIKSDAGHELSNKCEAMLQRIERMKQGSEQFHLVLDDPYGNSAIVGRHVTIGRLSGTDASDLETGGMSFYTGHASTDASADGAEKKR